MQTLNSLEPDASPEVIRRSLADLERYAGWLSKGYAPTRVRASVKALGNELAASGDVSAAIETLGADIGSLGSGEVAGLLRRALGELEEAARAGRGEQALAMLRQLVPEFGDADTAPSAASR